MNKEELLKAWHLDSNTFMTAVIPNTYTLLWNTGPEKIFNKLVKEKEKFWNEERLAKAKALNLSPEQVYTMASIVEEETNAAADKGKIASVYLNRMNKGMKLQADPTVKFVMKSFGVKRVREKHIAFISPYNTYPHLHLAKNYEKKGNLYSARKHYFETLKINSRPYFGYERLGIIALKTQDYKLAEKLFEDSEKRKSKLLKDGLNEVNNKNAETLAMLSATIENKNPSVIQADQYILSGDTTKVDSILSVLSKSPSVSKSELNNLYVKDYFLTNKFLPALEILKRELSVNPKNADIEYSIARCYAMMDKSLESRNALLDAVQHGFKYKWVYQYDAVFNKYKNEWHRIKDLIHQNSKI